MKRARSWDPDALPKNETYDLMNAKRIKIDLMEVVKDPPPGILVVYDESDISLAHALILGPPNTPYEGGFFYFIVRFPYNYPWYPPVVKLMTTGASTVRFNPNLYASGKVCLSILGTWTGPDWSPAMRMTTLLISIQSLLGDKPYYNEPGVEETRGMGGTEQNVKNYNDIVQHETLRVAVLGMVNNDFGLCIPDRLREEMESKFLESYEFYESVVQKNIKLNNKTMKDPFHEQFGKFQYKALLKRLQTTHEKLIKNSTNLSIPVPVKTDTNIETSFPGTSKQPAVPVKTALSTILTPETSNVHNTAPVTPATISETITTRTTSNEETAKTSERKM